MEKLDLIKIENLPASTNTIIRVERQYKEWKNMFPNYIFNKGLVSRIYKELLRKPLDIGLGGDFLKKN